VVCLHTRSTLIVSLLFVSTFLAGCVTDDLTAVTPPDPLRPDATDALHEIWVPTLDEIPEYGAWAREFIHHYAKTYHNRISFTPISEQATAFLMWQLRDLGYDVALKTYYTEASPIGLGPLGYDVIVATREGTVEPDRHIGLVAHHDARYSSNEAAYDDASGTAVTLAMAKYFAEVDTRKSITVLLFDGEELGLRGSCYYVNDIAQNGGPHYDMVFGYDMVGINWPGHEWKMYHMMGGPDDIETILPIAEHVYRDVLDLPEEGVEILTTHDRNSDERRFREAGVPIYRWAGGRHAADYPHYHELTDTYENMIEFAGGEENFELGISMVIKTSIAMVHAVDQYAFPEYTMREQPCSFYGPDDGPL
jgi:hypothetical protein